MCHGNFAVVCFTSLNLKMCFRHFLNYKSGACLMKVVDDCQTSKVKIPVGKEKQMYLYVK